MHLNNGGGETRQISLKIDAILTYKMVNGLNDMGLFFLTYTMKKYIYVYITHEFCVNI